eukprot:CAMPEP_0197028026 /NCGR_PEP_ID=MMETSP1384-20130603/7836_1 /TAXON_ID=29189 /ORGANISM="Ammonia sp." /LENGTH=1328 /DNA_ID=CAMNT_0042456963 /DNA_START=29 /DNA_END=4015 /DNA_ORIENTATION=-
MSYYKKKKVFRPRQRTNDEMQAEHSSERAKEEAKSLAQRLEKERRAKQMEAEQQQKLKRELEEIERRQAEIKQKEECARKYFADKEQHWKHRLKLREQNLAKSKSKSSSAKKSKNLETKIKKIQGFLKKTKQFEKHCKNVEALIKEMNKLKLGPYIDEIVKDLTNSAVTEQEDIEKLLFLASALHQRFEQKFTKPFKEQILDAFRPKLDLNDSNVRKKQVVNLMILIEMQYLGLLKGGNTLIELIKHVLKTEKKHKEKLHEKIKELSSKHSEASKEEDNDGEDKDNNYKMEDTKNKNEITSLIYEYDDIMIHSLELVLTFLKYANEECLGSVSAALRVHYEALGKEVEPQFHDILSEKQREQLMELVVSYYNKISDKYLELDLKLRKQVKLNKTILIERGSISDARQEITDKLRNVVSSLKHNIDSFCLHLHCVQRPVPLPFDDELELKIDGKDVTLTDAQNASFFDDEVSRSFYESLPHLKENIPGSLLQGDVIKNFDKIKNAESNNPRQHGDDDDDGDDDNENEIDNVDLNEMPKYLINNDDIMDDTLNIENVDFDEVASEEAENGGAESEKAGNQKGGDIKSMKQLMAALQCMGSRKETEHIAERFCYLNSKNNRKYLALYLSQIKSDQITRLPFYARFIAILNLCDINIGDRVCLSIEKEFYRLFFSQNKKWLMDAKMSNLSFIAELTKFSLFPFNSVFAILEKLSKKFNNESIELISFFMYQCGRFLYKNPLTHFRLNKVLKYLRRRQIQTNLDPFLKQHILNAIYACKPSETAASQKYQELSAWQQYVEHLLYYRLNHGNKQSVLRKLRKLDWKDQAVKAFVVERLFTLHYLNFNKIGCVAAIIQGLNCYHAISTTIVDNVCEEIRIGLEEEDFTQEQRRLAYVKFLGELYTYKAVNSQVIMDTLYLFITYNVDVEQPMTSASPTDDDDAIIHFRICLCCMLLETCGKYLRKGRLKARCDRFLLYFQRFIALHLPTPFPIEWWVNDVFKYIAPNLKRLHDLHEILEKIQQIEEASASHKDALSILDDDEEDDGDDEDVEEDDEDAQDPQQGQEDDDDDEEDEDDFEDDEESEDDTADVNSYHRKKKLTKQDQEFIDEYEAMMEQYRAPTTKKTSIHNLKHASVLAVSVPKISERPSPQQEQEQEEEEEEVEDEEYSPDEQPDDTVQFRLLTKKGASSNKVKVGLLKIPKHVIDAMKEKQKQESKYEDQIKSVTLQHLQTYEHEQAQEVESDDLDAQDAYDVDYDYYDMIDTNNNVISSTSKAKPKYNKSKAKEQSVSAKRKYKQGLKQVQLQKVEDEREKQKTQRDEKRKKQTKMVEAAFDV